MEVLLKVTHNLESPTFSMDESVVAGGRLFLHFSIGVIGRFAEEMQSCIL
jgi:hypothetical protein